MYDVRHFLEKAMQQQRNMLKIYEKRMRNLPEGSLSVYQKNGRQYYNKYQRGTTTYLGGDEVDEVQELKKRKLLFDMSARIKKNEPLILDFLERYQDPSPDSVRLTLGKAYQTGQIDLFSTYERSHSQNWGDQPYRKSENHLNQLTHRTLKGDLVRSKSEVIIANTYFTKGLQYRYEELTNVGNSMYAPDFKVLVPRLNKVKLHEHFGMMNNQDYRENAMRKIEYYIANGYRPYEDILFTFDDLEGNIDAQALDLLITNFMM